MKILIAVDGSEGSDAAVRALAQRPWPPETSVEILSVAHGSPEIPDPLLVGKALHYDSLNKERKRAHRDVDEAEAAIKRSTPFLTLSKKVLDGSPKEVILQEASEWGADLILMGSRGLGAAARFLLGSVAHAVALHASCSVEIVRSPGTQRS